MTDDTPVLVDNEGGPFWRGYKPGTDFKVNPDTGFVIPGS
jgi:hypothetical protein